MEIQVQTKISDYKKVFSTKFSTDDEFFNSIIQGDKNGLESEFLPLSILDAQVLRSKLNSLTQDYEKEAKDSYDFTLLNNLKQATFLLKDIYKVIDNYNILLTSLLADVDKNRPSFYDVFFPKKVVEVRNLILQLYPQTMDVGHYKEVFDLCGYAPFENNDNITQLTMKRLQTFLSYRVITKQIEVFENYTLAELSGIVREDKIKDIVRNFWDSGRLDNLQFIANENGGRLLLDGSKVKIFEVGTPETTTTGDKIFGLVFATPSFYSYSPEKLLNRQKGSYFFLGREPKLATCIVEIDQVLLRQDFIKSPIDTAEMKFKIKIQVPMNLFKFYVTKV